MTRFVIDVGALLYVVEHEIEVASDHRLLAPVAMRSHLLTVLHEAVAGGELPVDVARDRWDRARAIPMRQLGDVVMQRRAWAIADELGWASTVQAEYLALTQLQADAFITIDGDLRRQVDGIVDTATVDALSR